MTSAFLLPPPRALHTVVCHPSLGKAPGVLCRDGRSRPDHEQRSAGKTALSFNLDSRLHSRCREPDATSGQWQVTTVSVLQRANRHNACRRSPPVVRDKRTPSRSIAHGHGTPSAAHRAAWCPTALLCYRLNLSIGEQPTLGKRACPSAYCTRPLRYNHTYD